MVSLLLAVVEATFAITVSQGGQTLRIQYPVAEKLYWVEVCVEAEVAYQSGPDVEVLVTTSCWEPRFKIEQWKLAPGTLSVRGHLTISEDSRRSTLHTPVIQVRPRPQ